MKIGRNDPCHCGSGKKYKNCCMPKELDINSNKGCLYSNIFYPGYIALPEDETYFVEEDGIKSSILIKKHLEALEVLDFDNRLNEQDINKKTSVQIENSIQSVCEKNVLLKLGDKFVKCIEYEKHYHRNYSPRFYTELIIAYEISDCNNVTEQEYLLYEKILDRFLSVYRKITHDIKVRRFSNNFDDNYIVKTCVVKYSADEIIKTIEQRLTIGRKLTFSIKQMKYEKFHGSLPVVNKENEKIHNLQIHSCLEKNDPIILAEETLIKAFEELLLNKNYKYALLDAFISAETLIVENVNKAKMAKGVSKNKLDSYQTEIGISYIINVDLPLLIDDITDKERELLGCIDKVRKMRNDIVHNGKQCSEQDALFAINKVNELIYMIDNRLNVITKK
jgi:hypothetical protein